MGFDRALSDITSRTLHAGFALRLHQLHRESIMDKNPEWLQRLEERAARDPRQFPLGYLAGDSFVLSSTRVFCWFQSVDELAQSLLEDEPKLYGLDEPEQLAEYGRRVGPIVERIRKSGLAEETRSALNAAVEDYYRIEWWGTFGDLLRAEAPVIRNIVDAFLDEDQQGGVVKPSQYDDFVEYLETCGC
jgi:hypothetical protein